MEDIKPFDFKQCVTVIKSTGKKARNIRELRDRICDIPDESIFHHMYQYFLKEKRILEYTNDFSQWIGEVLNDRILSEQLSNMDPFTFNSVTALRAEIVRVLDEHLRNHPKTRNALPGNNFHFNESVTLIVPIGIQAGNLAEFLMAVKYVDPESIYFHFYEARVRPPLEVDDFSNWIEDTLDKKELAHKIRAIDPFMHSLDAARKHIIKLAEDELKNDMEKY